MSGFANIQEAISLYELSLIEHNPIPTVSAFAERTGYSPYHFARLFFSVAGISPKEYMQGRLLTHILDESMHSSYTLSSLSEQYGFSDYTTFSHAFKKRFGACPRYARDHDFVPYGRMEALVLKPVEKDSLSLLPPERKELEPFFLCGICFFIGDESVSFHTQWNTFMRAEKHIEGCLQPKQFYQYSSWLEGGGLHGLSVLCATAIEEPVIQKSIFTTRKVEGGTYLRFLHTGDISKISCTYQYIYRNWFALHTVKPRGDWEFQRYPQNEDIVEIYIPVRTETLDPN